MGKVTGRADLATALENLMASDPPDPADVASVVHYLKSSPEARQTVIDGLRHAREDVKVTLIQRFFTHPQAGTHRTEFDQEVMSDLLSGWFDISLDQPARRPAGRFSWASEGPDGIHTFAFGATQVFIYTAREKRAVLDSLAGLLGDDAVLTTDRTSPPSTLAELTPLWLKDPDRDPADHYICDSPAVDFESFFASYEAAIRSALGVTFRERSRELGFVLNGDGLRYHRDRLVNQYDVLARKTPAARERTRVVQDLSLVDWDMQDGTFSGTIFVHPLGDRYIFVLEPGMTVSLFFAEHVHVPGPMMMPFHCALPIQDSYANTTAGEATGKRFSCLMRGITDAAEVDRLTEIAVPGDIHERTVVAGGFLFPSGMRIEQGSVADCSVAGAGVGDYDFDEGCHAVPLSPRANAGVLKDLGLPSVAGVYRVTKSGDGFSLLRAVVPEVEGRDVVVVNRSVNTPQAGVSHPLTVRLPHLGTPVLQLIELRHDQTLTIPAEALNSLYVTPTATVLHRSAPLDAFYPILPRVPRMTTVLDVVVVAER